MFSITDEYIRKNKCEFYHYLVSCAYKRIQGIYSIGDHIEFSCDGVFYSGKVVNFELHQMLEHEIYCLEPFSNPNDQIHLIKLYVVFEPYEEKTWNKLVESDYKKYMVHHETLCGEPYGA